MDDKQAGVFETDTPSVPGVAAQQLAGAEVQQGTYRSVLQCLCRCELSSCPPLVHHRLCKLTNTRVSLLFMVGY